MTQHAESVGCGDFEIAQYQIEIEIVDRVDRLITVLGFVQVVTCLIEHPRNIFARYSFVVDDKNS